MTDPPPITQRDGAVLVQGAALPLMYRAALALMARRHRDGLAAGDLAAPSPAATCASPDRCRTEPAADEANPPTH